MLTPQEVSTHAFTKAVMGGYNMAMVDEFLDELTDDYTALYKENAALKAKMKVLVEKVEDYRSTEDAMRATLLTAQKMADSIIHEAEATRDQLLAQAESDAKLRINQLRQEADAAQERLRQGKIDFMKFVSAAKDVCNRELKFLEQLPDLPVEPSSAPQAATEIEEKVMASFNQTSVRPSPAEAVPAFSAAPIEAAAPPVVPSMELTEKLPVERPPVAETVEKTPVERPRPSVERPIVEQTHFSKESPKKEEPSPPRHPEASSDPATDPFGRILDEPTRRLNLDDLKFGQNYRSKG